MTSQQQVRTVYDQATADVNRATSYRPDQAEAISELQRALDGHHKVLAALIGRLDVVADAIVKLSDEQAKQGAPTT